MVRRVLSRVRTRRWAAGAAVIVSLLLGAALAAWGLTRAAPPWWEASRPPDAALGERVEHAAVAQLTVRRDPDPAADGPAFRSAPWSVSLTSEDADAWLGARLPMWLASRYPEVEWPGSISRVGVRFGEGVVHVAARVVENGKARVIAAELEPRLGPDGALWVRARRVTLGRLPVPVDWVVNDAGLVPAGDEVVRRIAAALLGQGPVVEEAVIRLEDGRRVRLVGLAAREGRLEITCVTEAGP